MELKIKKFYPSSKIKAYIYIGLSLVVFLFLIYLIFTNIKNLDKIYLMVGLYLVCTVLLFLMGYSYLKDKNQTVIVDNVLSYEVTGEDKIFNKQLTEDKLGEFNEIQ